MTQDLTAAVERVRERALGLEWTADEIERCGEKTSDNATIIAWKRRDAADLRALLSAVTWRPISEAPKDGTAMLGFIPSTTGFLDRWVQFWWAEADDLPARGFWFSWGQSVHPTHFLPLPPPPEAR
jgi:hypothetical protein